MKTKKTIIILAATTALLLATIGIAFGHYATNQTGPDTNSPYQTNTETDLWGWFRGCLGFRARQPNGYTYQPPTNDQIPPTTNVPQETPNQPQTPNQDPYAYGWGYRRGCCGW